MWTRDPTSVRDFERTIFSEGYLVACGSSVGYTYLHKENTPFGRAIFGDIFHIFKANPKQPLEVRQNSQNGAMYLWPTNGKYQEVMPVVVHGDEKVWNAAQCMLLPGEFPQNKIPTCGMNRFIFPDAFVSRDAKRLPVTLLTTLISAAVGFDGNYSNFHYSFAPPAQVSNHLFAWLTTRHQVISHEKTFKQREEGEISIARQQVREQLVPILAGLEKKFGEKLDLPH